MARVSVAKTARQVNRKIARISSEALKQVAKSIEPEIQEFVERKMLSTSPEVMSLKTGELRGEFGITEAGNKVNKIVKAIAKEAQLKISFDSRSTRLTVELFNNTAYSRLVRMPEGIQKYNRVRFRGRKLISLGIKSLPWLQWLLLEGNATVVENFYVNTPSSHLGRSGLPYLMRYSSRGFGYSVNPLYKGYIDNNFITRFFQNNRTGIENILRAKRNILEARIRRGLLS